MLGRGGKRAETISQSRFRGWGGEERAFPFPPLLLVIDDFPVSGALSRFYDHESRVHERRNTLKLEVHRGKPPRGGVPRFLSMQMPAPLLMTTQMPWAQNRRPRYFSPPLHYLFPHSRRSRFSFFSFLPPPIPRIMGGGEGKAFECKLGSYHLETWRR